MAHSDYDYSADFDEGDDGLAHAPSRSRTALQQLEEVHAPAVVSWSQPAACGLRSRRRGRAHPFDIPDHLGEDFRGWLDRTPPGWHGLLAETLRKLEAVIDPGPDTVKRPWRVVEEGPNFFAGPLTPEEWEVAFGTVQERRHDLKLMTLTVTDTALKFEVMPRPGTGRVIEGILRKAQSASRCTCRQCGDVGRERHWSDDSMGWDMRDVQSDDLVVVGQNPRSATLCARCFAPLLLRQHLRVLSHHVKAVIQQGKPVRQNQLPRLLRKSFVNQARDDMVFLNDGPEVGWDDPAMEPEAFGRWAGSWTRIGETLRLREIRR